MSIDKSPHRYGALVGPEGTYGTAPSFDNADDAVLLIEKPIPEIDYLVSGERPNGPGLSPLKRAGKAGRFGEVDLVAEFIGAGSAYSASNLSHLDRLIQAGGHDAAVDTTVDAEKVDYTPSEDPASWQSVAAKLFPDGEVYLIEGAFVGGLEIVSEGGEIPTWTFPLMGVVNTDIADGAIPSLTYPTDQPPKAVNIGLSVGDFDDAVVRGFTFRTGVSLAARADENSGGHAGYAGTSRAPQLEIEVEKTSLVGSPFHDAAGLDARKMEENATEVALDLNIGSVQYNRFTISAAQAQVANVDDGDDDASALWTIAFELMESAPLAEDHYTITAD